MIEDDGGMEMEGWSDVMMEMMIEDDGDVEMGDDDRE